MRKEVNKMNACEGYTVDRQLYLDDELGGGRLREFLAHLRICRYCRSWLEEQLALSATLRESRPLYSAPPRLRAQKYQLEPHLRRSAHANRDGGVRAQASTRGERGVSAYGPSRTRHS